MEHSIYACNNHLAALLDYLATCYKSPQHLNVIFDFVISQNSVGQFEISSGQNMLCLSECEASQYLHQ